MVFHSSTIAMMHGPINIRYCTNIASQLRGVPDVFMKRGDHLDLMLSFTITVASVQFGIHRAYEIFRIFIVN